MGEFEGIMFGTPISPKGSYVLCCGERGGSSGMGKTSRDRQIACRTTIELSLLWKLTLCAFLFRQMDPRFVFRWYYRYFLCVHGV